jgi:hypothetical protein
MGDRTVALLRAPDDLLGRHPDVFGPDARTRCLSLASALAAGPPWERLRHTATLAVRPDAGLIGILGEVDEADRALVGALGGQVPDLLRRLRPVPNESVVDGVVRLAERIRARVPADELRRHHLVPIPRGGLIVAALLAYLLELPIAPSVASPDGEPVILVDDCAISGLRLRESLAPWRGRRTGVALLHAHPDLCRAVEAKEPGVAFCVAADQLADHAPDREDYADWHRRWTDRSVGTYWIGDPDHVCYPWNEPDALVWNEVRAVAEPGWRVVPPSWCLKNRATARPGDVQVCEPPAGASRPAESLIWARVDEGVLLAGAELGPPVLLREDAGRTWLTFVQGRVDDTDPAAASLLSALERRGMVHTGGR